MLCDRTDALEVSEQKTAAALGDVLLARSFDNSDYFMNTVKLVAAIGFLFVHFLKSLDNFKMMSESHQSYNE